MNRVRMPALGQTSDEIDIVAWLKAPGDEVAEGEPLLEVETDKATLQIEASSSGTLVAIVHEAGETVSAGDVIGWIGEAGEEIPAGSEPPEGAGRPVPGHQAVPPAPTVPAAPAAGVLATPAVRALAREKGVDLKQVEGTGPGGRIDRDDVLRAAARRRDPRGG